VNEIDLLRFVAALSVVLFHYSFRGCAADDLSVMGYPPLAPLFKYGYLGVELFFMISGFVILMTASGRGLQAFVVSRIVRIYPAFWACCTVTFLTILFIGKPPYSATFAQYVVNLTMLSGFAGVLPIDGAYWTLFVELRFYALVGVVLATGRIRRIQTLLLLWLLASAAMEIRPVSTVRQSLISDYAAFFIAGAACWLIWSDGLSMTRVCTVILAWGLAVMQTLQRLRYFTPHFRTPASWRVVATVITVFFVVMLLVASRRTGPVGRMRWGVVGSLTYPLYLLHQNVGFMLFNVSYGSVNVHVLFWGVTAGMLAAAYAVHRAVERPFAPRLKQLAEGLSARLQRVVVPAGTG
jgi:peptidoglycan/LPS O-acetylase OafA/YrhL